MLARYFLRKFRGLDDGQTLVCAPEALSRFYLGENQWDRVGATWMTKEDRQHEIEDQHAYLDALLQTLQAQICPDGGPLPALTLLGFSQGTATAWRWLAHSPLLPSGTLSHLVLWAGSMPPEPVADPSRWAGLRLTYVYGQQDEYLTDERVAALQTIVAATGADVQYVCYNGGHAIDEAVLASIA
jgi:predicted esterase